MSSRLSRAVVTLCVRLDVPACSQLQADGPLVNEVALRLLEGLLARQFPATWAIAEPIESPIARRVAPSSSEQEIALAVAAGDTPREQARLIMESRAAGLRIVTAVACDSLVDEQFERLAKLGITSLSGSPLADSSRRRTQPAMPRFGAWCFSDAVTLPGTSRWSAGGGGLRTVRSALETALKEQGLVQIGIDLPAVVRRGRAAERVVLRVIDLVERQRGIGKVDVGTLASTAALLSGQCAGKPSRSILRPAAA